MDTVAIAPVVGQKIHCILYGGRDGIIYQIDGQTSPETVQSIGGGVGVMGGRATFHVVFDDGGISVVPESIVYGVQWDIYPEVASSEEIKTALAFSAEVKARRAEEERQRQERLASEREALRTDPEYKHLLKREDRPEWSDGRRVGENVRRQLKKAFPDVKFKVTSDHNSVDVKWTDGPTSDKVKAIVRRHEGGYFDGMDDSYKHVDNSFADVFGDVRYVFCARNDTLAGVRKAWELKGGRADEVPESWENGGRWSIPNNLGEHMFMAWSSTDLSGKV